MPSEVGRVGEAPKQVETCKDQESKSQETNKFPIFQDQAKLEMFEGFDGGPQTAMADLSQSFFDLMVAGNFLGTSLFLHS